MKIPLPYHAGRLQDADHVGTVEEKVRWGSGRLGNSDGDEPGEGKRIWVGVSDEGLRHYEKWTGVPNWKLHNVAEEAEAKRGGWGVGG